MTSFRRNLVAVFAAAQVLVLFAWFGPFGHDGLFLLAVRLGFLLIPAGVLIHLLRAASLRSLARAYVLLTANALAFLGYLAMSFSV